MVQDIMPGTEEQLRKEMTTGYVGFDPTANSLHIGNLVSILLLVHLQRAGHKPIALVGGATGMVGDPSGKSEERNFLSEDVLAYNQVCIKAQLEKFLDFDHSKTNAAEMVNNYDWFQSFTFLQFIRDVGKFITVNYMMAKDSVRKRLEGDSGMSFTEFTYQLVQGYDYYWLYKHKNIKLQMGGSDQWGNIVTGTELIRRKEGGEAFAITAPLITRADGGKFGKTEKGTIWLDSARTSPYEFYQFWLNATDADATKWIKVFTFLNRDEIESLVAVHEMNPEKRTLQQVLAREVTAYVHGNEELEKAIEITAKLFGNADPSAGSLTREDLESMQGVLKIRYPLEKLRSGIDVTSFLSESGIFPSKGEARKMIQNGGVSINRTKVTDASQAVDAAMLLHDEFLLVQKGKKHYYLVSADS